MPKYRMTLELPEGVDRDDLRRELEVCIGWREVEAPSTLVVEIEAADEYELGQIVCQTESDCNLPYPMAETLPRPKEVK